ncbi:MAG: cation:proton antiporter [Patescibacteria group bacterium]|nr:MAG: cation:proton antiporter [Patescibacteria group bacterium]
MPTEFISFFVILLAGLFFSGIFNRLHLPWVAALIIAGIAVGPYAFDIFAPNPAIEFMGNIGLVFLMFMAGLETRISSFKKDRREIGILVPLSAAIPFSVGFGIGIYFEYPFLSAIFLGIIFISSSIAVIIPSLQTNNLFGKRVGKLIMGSTIITDILSLTLLSILLQTIEPATKIPLPLFYLLLFGSLILLMRIIPKIVRYFERHKGRGRRFESELRLIVTILLGTVVIFELLGLHAIIAGFFAGLVLSETITHKVIREKLHTISYGIFIPIFFVLVGVSTNIGIFAEVGNALLITFVVVIGSVSAKFISGFIGGRLDGFSKDESALIGVATTPHLSTTLAAIFIGFKLGILDEKLLTAMIILSIITTLIAPTIMGKMAKRLDRRAASPTS